MLPDKVVRYSRIFTVLTISSALAIIINVSGCNRFSGSTKKQVVFDVSHREIFSPTSTAKMGLSEFCRDLSDNGYRLQVNKQPIDTKSLMGSELLILAGPMTEFNQEELQAITEFVKGGGNLLVLIHIAQPVLGLTERFDIQPSLATICDQTDPVENSPQDFYVTDFAEHPLGPTWKN